MTQCLVNLLNKYKSLENILHELYLRSIKQETKTRKLVMHYWERNLSYVCSTGPEMEGEDNVSAGRITRQAPSDVHTPTKVF